MRTQVPQIFSKARRIARWRRALARQARGDAADFVFAAMAEEFEDRLGFTNHRAERALLIGDPSGRVAAELAGRSDALRTVSPLDFDEEAPFEGAYDLIASAGSLDTVNDLPGALMHIRTALAPKGLALLSFLGAGSLPHLRRALLAAEPDRQAARMHPMVDVRSAAALMQRAGFTSQVADGFALKVRYGSLDRLVGDLRDQGLTNALASAPPALSGSAAEVARRAFLEAAEADGKVTETFEILVLTGWG
jgi:SAM-dependent methyltransferase